MGYRTKVVTLAMTVCCMVYLSAGSVDFPFLTLNDVYAFGGVTRVATAKKELNAAVLLSCGDFLGSYAVAHFDGGRGMSTVFEAAGVDFTICGKLWLNGNLLALREQFINAHFHHRQPRT
jgi:hypothetical protein